MDINALRQQLEDWTNDTGWLLLLAGCIVVSMIIIWLAIKMLKKKLKDEEAPQWFL